MSKVISNRLDEVRELSLRDIASVLFRHKAKALAFFLAVVAVALYKNATSREVYESEAKLIVHLGRESVTLDPTATTGQTLHVSRSLASQINSELEILRSRDLLESLVDTIGAEEVLGIEKNENETASEARVTLDPILERLGLRREVPLETVAVNVLKESLSIGVQPNSSIIRVGFSGHSPELAQRVVGLLIERYLDKHIEVHQTAGSRDFFVEQTEELRERLGDAHQQLREVRQETGIVSYADQERMLLSRIDDLGTSMAAAEADLENSKARQATLDEMMAGMPETTVSEEIIGIPNEALQSLQTTLLQLELREKELQVNYFDDSPFVISVRNQIEQAKSRLSTMETERTQQTVAPNAARAQLELMAMTERLDGTATEARLTVLRRQLEEALREQAKLGREEFRITRLERDIERDQKTYERYVDNLEQTRIYDALEQSKISNIGVLQEATHSGVPVGPRRMRNLATALFFGLFGALGLAFVADFMDQTIKTPTDAHERLELATLVSVPRSRRPAVQAPGRWDKEELEAAGWSLPAALTGVFKNLRTQVLHPVAADRPLRIVGVAACYPGSGVSTVTANLGTSLAAAEEGRVLMVDANLTAPRIHSIFGAELSPGLADLVAAQQRDPRTIQATPVPGLDLLAAGIPAAPTSYDDMAHFSDLFHSVRDSYRIVLVDLPPIIDNAFSIRLARLCDTTLLVVESETERRPVVERAKNDLQRAGVDIAGVVLNKRRYPIPEWLYRLL